MVWGTSIDTDWTNFPARPSYLPFTQQITSYLSEKVLPPRTVESGLPITHYLKENEKDLEFSLALPNGSSRKLVPRKRKDRYILEFTETRLPGTYELSDPESIVSKFVVLPSVGESFLEKAPENEIVSTATALADNVVRLDGREGKRLGIISIYGQSKKIWSGNMANSPRHCSWTCFHGNHLIETIRKESSMNFEQEKIRLFMGR